MIYSDKAEAHQPEFETLLARSEQSLRASLQSAPEPLASDVFERAVCDHMKAAASGTGFEHSIQQTSDNAFPDIVARRYFGVEVKMTKKDDWRSTGNSVREHSRLDGIERIYMLFGKFGGGFDVRTRLYQECLSEVAVTHSPRYLIDMTLPDGKSIFDKMGVDYDVLRHDPQIIPRIKSYYRAQLKEGQELWWLQDDRAVSPIIRPFNTLTDSEQRALKIDSLILFPEILGTSRTKYERVAAYWIAEHGVVSSSLRDAFTAGGRKEISGLGVARQVDTLLLDVASELIARLMTLDETMLTHYWRVSGVAQDRVSQWLELAETHATTADTLSPRDVLTAGLEGGRRFG